MHTLEFAATTFDVAAATELAQVISGTTYIDERPNASKLPFQALVTGVTDNLEIFDNIADVGLYVICRRIIKPGVPNIVGLFPMLHHADKNHQQCDAHWRDVHAPLALEHHIHMTHYAQLSVVHKISGPDIDGFALCGFASTEDLRERFYTTPESVEIIQKDVLSFAHTKNSPRRLIATPKTYSSVDYFG